MGSPEAPPRGATDHELRSTLTIAGSDAPINLTFEEGLSRALVIGGWAQHPLAPRVALAVVSGPDHPGLAPGLVHPS